MKKIILGFVLASLWALGPLPAVAQSPLQDGYAAFQKKNYTAARAQLEPLSKNGNKVAQYLIGIMHENGLGGFSKSNTKAFRLYKLSAEQDFDGAAENVANMYYSGTGTPKNYRQAYKWYNTVGRKGKNAVVLKRLGDMYDLGRGVKKSAKTAASYYQKSANLGYSKGQTNLGYMYAEGRGIKQSNIKAVNWYRKAAEQGNSIGQTNLGTMYAEGIGVTQSYATAAKWYRKAANLGYARAQNALGFYYQKGRAVTQSYTKAVSWYRKAAKQGFAESQFNLGVMLYVGKGVPKNRKRGIVWIKKAAGQNYKKAKNALVKLGVK